MISSFHETAGGQESASLGIAQALLRVARWALAVQGQVVPDHAFSPSFQDVAPDMSCESCAMGSKPVQSPGKAQWHETRGWGIFSMGAVLAASMCRLPSSPTCKNKGGRVHLASPPVRQLRFGHVPSLLFPLVVPGQHVRTLRERHEATVLSIQHCRG